MIRVKPKEYPKSFNKERKVKKTSIRHPKTIPTQINDSAKVTFQDFIDHPVLGKKLRSYENMLTKLFKNSTSIKPIVHLSKYLDDKELEDLEVMVYFLAYFGFKFTDIHYMFLNTFSISKPSLWTKELSKILGKPLLQIPVHIHLYKDDNNLLKKLVEEYKKKSTIPHLNKNKHQERLEKIIETVKNHKIALINLETQEILTIEQLYTLRNNRKNRKK